MKNEMSSSWGRFLARVTSTRVWPACHHARSDVTVDGTRFLHKLRFCQVNWLRECHVSSRQRTQAVGNNGTLRC